MALVWLPQGENKNAYILSWEQVLLEEDTVLSFPANH